MRGLRVMLLITLSLTACSVTESPIVKTPIVTASTTSASGAFAVTVDFNTLAVTPLGHTCLVEASLAVTFTGTLTGTAEGPIHVLGLAPCAAFIANPPGTFRDVFRAGLTFAGQVAGEVGTATITYQGLTRPGGAVRGLFRVDGETGSGADVRGVLQAEAQAGVGGRYSGLLTNTP